VFSDADPKAPVSISPIEDQHHDYESESSDDSSTEPIDRFQMINKDPDNIHGVRSVMRDIDFLPDRVTLEYRQRLATASTEMKQSDVSSIEESFCSSPSSSPSNSSTRKRASGLSDKLKRGVAGLKPANRHHRKGILLSEEIPGNAVYVRSSKAKLAQLRLASSSSEDTTTPHIADSSFNPMLLVKTVKAHDGAAWCAAFSRDGRFLSTGGQDGNVTIWAVAPKSQMLHPQGVRTRENVPKDDKEKEQFPPLSFIGLGPELATNTEIISSEPIQRYRDHTSDVIDLSWSEFYSLQCPTFDHRLLS
jgi:WD40 repeat protein